MTVDDIFLKIGYANWVRVDAVRLSGGIWVFWKDTVVVDVISTNPQFILLNVRDLLLRLSVVYGSPNGILRDKILEELYCTKLNIQRPWLSIGITTL